MSSQLNYFFTKNHNKYEDLLFRLEILQSMEVKLIVAFVDSLQIVQQAVTGMYQCLKGSLNIYIGKCLHIIITQFAEFQIQHIPRHENNKANMLGQQASSYDISGHDFHIQEKLVGKDQISTCLQNWLAQLSRQAKLVLLFSMQVRWTNQVSQFCRLARLVFSKLAKLVFVFISIFNKLRSICIIWGD